MHFLGGGSSPSTSAEDFSGGNTVTYDVSSDSFTVKVNHGGISLNQTFLPADIVVTPNTTLTIYQKPGGVPSIGILKPGPAGLDLQYVTFGNWANSDGSMLTFGGLVFGIRTPTGAVPKTGTASYAGETVGMLFDKPSGHAFRLTGDVTLAADFLAATVIGNLTNMETRDLQGGALSTWGDLKINATISGNTFSGTAGSKDTTLADPLGGTASGGFFGPAAQEIGGSWNVLSGKEMANGTFVGKK